MLKKFFLNSQIGQIELKPFLWVRRRQNNLSDLRCWVRMKSPRQAAEVTVTQQDGLVSSHQLSPYPYLSDNYRKNPS